MAIPQAVTMGLAGNELSKKITGTSEVSAGRTAVATGAGAVLTATAAGGVAAAGIISAPIIAPVVIAGAAVSFIASLFD